MNWWHPAPDWTLVGWTVSEFVSSFCQNQLNWASTQYAKAYKKPGCYPSSQRISTSLDLQWWFSTSSLDLLTLKFRCLSLHNLKRKSWLVCRLSQSEDSLFPTGIIHVSILSIWYFYILYTQGFYCISKCLNIWLAYQGMQPWDGHSKYVFCLLKHNNKLNQNEENTDCICCIAGFGLFNGLQFFILRFKVVYCEKHNNNTHFAIFALTSSVLCYRFYKNTNPGVSFFLSFCFVPGICVSVHVHVWTVRLFVTRSHFKGTFRFSPSEKRISSTWSNATSRRFSNILLIYVQINENEGTQVKVSQDR